VETLLGGCRAKRVLRFGKRPDGRPRDERGLVRSCVGARTLGATSAGRLELLELACSSTCTGGAESRRLCTCESERICEAVRTSECLCTRESDCICKFITRGCDFGRRCESEDPSGAGGLPISTLSKKSFKSSSFMTLWL